MNDLNTTATLKHINVRKEGPDDEQRPALDLKFEANADAEYLDEIISTDDERANLRNVLWDDDGNPRLIQIEKIGLNYQLHNANLVITDINETLEHCTAKRFSVIPRERWIAELTLSVSCNEPSKQVLPLLAEFLHESVFIKLQPTQVSCSTNRPRRKESHNETNLQNLRG